MKRSPALLAAVIAVLFVLGVAALARGPRTGDPVVAGVSTTRRPPPAPGSPGGTVSAGAVISGAQVTATASGEPGPSTAQFPAGGPADPAAAAAGGSVGAGSPAPAAPGGHLPLTH